MYLSFCILAFCAFSASVFKSATALPSDLEAGVFKVYKPPDPVVEDCKTKHNLSEEIFKKLETDPETLLNHPETQCYAACLMIGRNTLNADGTLNMSQVHKGLPKNVADRENVIAGFNSCTDKTGKDICEKAYKTITCIHSHEAIKNIRPST